MLNHARDIELLRQIDCEPNASIRGGSLLASRSRPIALSFKNIAASQV
jgi:hypothetical protein